MIHLYLEHLLNINALSIQATLPTPSNSETNVALSQSGDVLTLTHHGESASIRLPANVLLPGQNMAHLIVPAVPSTELSFRVPLDRHAGDSNGDSPHSKDTNIIPWTASSLTTETEMRCKTCNSLFIRRNTIREWKDLPSEGWAEMMDFWHCHKPNEPYDHTQSQPKRGYAADSQLAIRSGHCLVGVSDFWLAIDDCKSVKMVGDQLPPPLLCSLCKEVVGQADPSSQAYLLRKSQVSLALSPQSLSTSYKIEQWFACIILDAVENQGVRKFTTHEPGLHSRDSLKLWVFTPDLTISSSAHPSVGCIRCCKILWQACSAPLDFAEKLTASTLPEGELKLADGETALLRTILQHSDAFLPEKARRFQEWHVGILERFEADVES